VYGHGKAAYDSLPRLIQAINIIADKQEEIIDAVNEIIGNIHEKGAGE
jgi:hypothetical protein